MATSVTPEIFLATYPEFNDVPGAYGLSTDTMNAVVQAAIGYADGYLSDSAFGVVRDYALGLFVAHRLCIRYSPLTGSLQTHAKPGVEASQGVSPSGLNITVAHSALVTGTGTQKADLARTDYGLEYLSLIEAGVAPIGVTGTAGGSVGEQCGNVAGMYPQTMLND